MLVVWYSPKLVYFTCESRHTPSRVEGSLYQECFISWKPWRGSKTSFLRIWAVSEVCVRHMRDMPCRVEGSSYLECYIHPNPQDKQEILVLSYLPSLLRSLLMLTWNKTVRCAERRKTISGAANVWLICHEEEVMGEKQTMIVDWECGMYYPIIYWREDGQKLRLK